MNDQLKTYEADHELATLLRAAAQAGERVHIRGDDEIYELRVSVAKKPRDLWADYDPEGVRAAVRRSTALGSSTDPAEIAPLIAEIRAQRDQAERHTGT